MGPARRAGGAAERSRRLRHARAVEFPNRSSAQHRHSSLLAPSEAAKAALRDADAILSLDYLDLAGVLKLAGVTGSPTVVSAALDRYAHNAASRDHQAVCNIDLDLALIRIVSSHRR